ncbi:SCAN box domain-containing protein [Trichonephila clavipes]|nr:SCAN box domain-containing protein [Trichonephila clavipes]
MEYLAKGNKPDLLSVCEEMGVEVDQSSKEGRISSSTKEGLGGLLVGGFTTAELSNILAREPTDRANNYDFVKDLILKRYRLNSEKLKQCIYRHQKSGEKSWRNYAHELNSYFTEWIAELQVKTFEQLKDLLITEQLKYRVPAEVREHFLDDWIKLKTPYELAEKLDEYESIKQSFREIPKKNCYKF